MKILMSLLVLITVYSCAQDSSEDENYSTYYPQNYSSLEEELRKTDFSCRNQNDCPENVGLVYINYNGSDYNPQVARCTGFLLENNIVATNSHCIPSHLKNSLQSCEGQLAIRFMGNEDKQVFGCKELLTYSNLGLYDPDYSFFKIEQSEIKPLKISQSGISDNQSIVLARVTPSQHSLGGTLSVENCRVVLGSLLNLKATNSFSQTGLALDCEGVSGNSGSPVLNIKGEVIGILQSKMKEQFLTNLEETFKKFGLDLPDEVMPHFIFTNLSCVESENVLTKNKACILGEKLSFSSCLELDTEENEKRAARVFDVWKDELPRIFVYNIITDAKDGSVSAEPICVKSEKQFRPYNTFVEKVGIIGFRKDKIVLNYPRTIKLGAKFEVDDDLRLAPTMEFREDYRAEYKLDLELEGSQKWTGHMNSTYSYRSVSLSNLKIPLELKLCSNTDVENGNISLVRTLKRELISEEVYLKDQVKNEKVSCRK